MSQIDACIHWFGLVKLMGFIGYFSESCQIDLSQNNPWKSFISTSYGYPNNQPKCFQIFLNRSHILWHQISWNPFQITISNENETLEKSALFAKKQYPKTAISRYFRSQTTFLVVLARFSPNYPDFIRILQGYFKDTLEIKNISQKLAQNSPIAIYFADFWAITDGMSLIPNPAYFVVRIHLNIFG